MNIHSDVSSLSDLNDVLKDADLAQRGKRTLKYGRKFVLAVIFYNLMSYGNSLKRKNLISLLLQSRFY